MQLLDNCCLLVKMYYYHFCSFDQLFSMIVKATKLRAIVQSLLALKNKKLKKESKALAPELDQVHVHVVLLVYHHNQDP